MAGGRTGSRQGLRVLGRRFPEVAARARPELEGTRASALVRGAGLDAAVPDRRGQGVLSSARQVSASGCWRKSGGLHCDRERLSRSAGVLPAPWTAPRFLRRESAEGKPLAGEKPPVSLRRSRPRRDWTRAAGPDADADVAGHAQLPGR